MIYPGTKTNILSLLILILFLPIFSQAQEVITPVAGNPVRESIPGISPGKKKSLAADVLELPFIDDFSNTSIAPDPEKWMDNNAFINNTYPINPVTIGVATLDAYNSQGAHYPSAGSKSYIADYLTSQNINLNYPTSENIYFSFFYQARGRGEIPDSQDSLCLEFYSPDADEWSRVWSLAGGIEMRNFQQVLIPVNDKKYLVEGFRFRFLNYASQSSNSDFEDKFSNIDHWHIDYVKLDKNRNPNDTLLPDVAFTKSITSIFNDFEALPWKHLEAAYFTQRKPTIPVQITNLDNNTRNVSRFLEITDLYNNISYKTTQTASDIFSGEAFDYDFEFDYPFDFSIGDSALLKIKAILRTDAGDYKPNDTLTYYQVLNNFYAYDDGSAEAGYGINGQGTKNASVAVKFNSYIPDSLWAVDMYFNQVLDSLNLNYYFYLNIWEDNNGKPGDLIYSQLGEKPIYSPTINTPVRYMLDSAIAVNDVFYVGWTKTVDKISNIGLDLNRNNSANNFYNLGLEWKNSSISGTLMLRPVLGEKPFLSGNQNHTSSIPAPLSIYPNPASDFIMLDIPEINYTNIPVKIYTLTGKLVLEKKLSSRYERIELFTLNSGFYLITINLPGIAGYTGKFIIQK